MSEREKRVDWKDCTSYSQNGDRTPHWWEMRLGNLRVSVGNSHRYVEPGKWVMHCEPWYDTFILRSDNEESAKTEALLMVEQQLKLSLEELRSR